MAVASALLLTGAGAAQAHGNDGRGGKQWQQPQPQPKKQQTSEPETTGAYVYLKKDVSKPVSWENSTQQYLVTTWPGGYWRDLTLEEIRAALPAGVTVCGPGWAVQEDKAYGDATVFTGNKAPHYPTDYIGWRSKENPKGALFDAKHFELSAMVTVPPCAPAPTTSPSPTPTASPSPTSTPTPTVPVATPPAPSQTPTTPASPTPTVTPTPVTEVGSTPTPTQTTPVVVVASTPSPSATFYSEVLAAGPTGGATLAATGSSPLPGVLAAGILVLSGAALLLIRRRRAS
ncbi:LPXTG cell wall anchor domain-containing protein [Cellulomonas sp. Root137]|uniref:LPXTG cell wall anchor domain-containing protein n=1 Tax=Cellulomonas sp. Root137 TaxID=1736459 RepID=UPI0006FE82FA|nr:LPXTG cell wall anchor domain-containing protein [Cellulomonas sp. Root137]KQY47255.1 hypothetical protein ASD18_07825 [Cellulomonas sp. Root137]KRD44397.1 hypothetical protein ASE38_09730 [Cellulomonas sp. Root930]